MSDGGDVEQATRRLIAALDSLEAAVNRRLEADRGEALLASQVHALGLDRARLASELDEAMAQSRALDQVNRDVARRVDVAMDNIRSVLDGQDRLHLRPDPRQPH
jgi:hypothetical protein